MAWSSFAARSIWSARRLGCVAGRLWRRRRPVIQIVHERLLCACHNAWYVIGDQDCVSAPRTDLDRQLVTVRVLEAELVGAKTIRKARTHGVRWKRRMAIDIVEKPCDEGGILNHIPTVQRDS